MIAIELAQGAFRECLVAAELRLDRSDDGLHVSNPQFLKRWRR
jgi:hypothetical protein